MHLVILYFHTSKGEQVVRLLKRRTRLYSCKFGVLILNLKISMHPAQLYYSKSKGELVARLLKRRTRTSIRDHKSDSLFLHNNITPSCIEFEMTAKALLLWIDQRGQSYFALDPTV